MKVTVAICTWNRANLLDQTLTQMRHLRIPAGVEWELVVVNNNCTDDTDTVLARHSGSLPLRRLVELKQGHSNARNKAVDEATGELLLWTDDDVLVDPLWLTHFVNAAHDFPEAAFFGGTVDPWFERHPPPWVTRHLDELGVCYAIRQFGLQVCPLREGELPFGANMAFRTHVLRKYPFDPTLGRIGKGMLGGDETTVLNAMLRDGHSGVWVGAARVHHFIPMSRLTLGYVWEFFRSASFSHNRDAPQSGWTLFGAPAWAYRAYCQTAFKTLLLSGWKGKSWLRAFRAAAYYRGVLDGSWERRKSLATAPVQG
jgi:glycosyltransferase involved in cell wall biosynthesis